jgi:hypothetical protein
MVTLSGHVRYDGPGGYVSTADAVDTMEAKSATAKNVLTMRLISTPLFRPGALVKVWEAETASRSLYLLQQM